MSIRTAIPVEVSAALAALSILFACGSGVETERKIERSQTYRPMGDPIRWDVPLAQRLGVKERVRSADKSGLHWTTPPGWQEVQPTSLRLANFIVAGDDRTQCYLTVLGGTGGGAAANVNRWRNQMSLDQATPDEIAALPRAELFGQQAIYVDLEGTWTGSGQEAADYRMVGLVLVEDGVAKFLKLLGPKSVVEGQIEAFVALAASFHEDVPGAHGADAGSSTTAASAPTDSSAQGLAWQPPDGWRRGPERMMRVVTFFVGDDDVAECYVSVLAGTGGGALANVNRWRGQMGREGIDQIAFDALPRIEMLGGEGILVEASGTYTGMGDQPPREGLLLGAVCNLRERSVFVKMIGPTELLAAEREGFIGFCTSLEEAW